MLYKINDLPFSIILIMLYTIVGYSQNNYVGKVVDEQSNTIDNVTIYNSSSGKHTHTNLNGSFVLENVAINDSIHFSILGYKEIKKQITQNDLDNAQRIILEIANISLEQVLITSELNVLSSIVDVDVKNNPVISSQEILRKVPGLIIGQHAGGGKAEQIFLRGFDVDHGTDVALSVDGLPVNMVSHAHGQGYADLHFVIPETIESVNFGKGPYYFDKGNFNTAGFVDLKLKTSIDRSKFSLEAGQFNSSRFVGLVNLANNTKTNAYLASEIYLTDGPFESPQNFNRFNIMAQLDHSFNDNDRLQFRLSHFESRWDASGQIPQRAIDQGLISRFGAIDDTEGGETNRSNMLIKSFNQFDNNKQLNSSAFLSYYNFELYSNFTFFLNDSVNGDQIRQKEQRILAGAESIYEHHNQNIFNTFEVDYNLGVGFRYDNNDNVELSRTLNRRTTLLPVAFGDIDELNLYGFVSAELKKDKWKFIPSLRIDHFRFNYNDMLSELYNNQSVSETVLSPKFNTLYSASKHLQFFLKTGIGFHSNDSRVVIANEGTDILPKAYGIDLGTILKPADRMVINATLWSLFLDQEFVYVGDEGVVEPSGKSKRLGVELGLRYQALDWLYLYSDINYTHARSSDEPDGKDLIPLAPDFTSVGGITIDYLKNFSGSISYRYIDDRPANEDNSIVADGYFITDASLNYAYKNWEFGLIIENLFDSEWKETQFATESRLFNENQPVEEIHFTPGSPLYIRGKLAVSF